MRHLVWVVTWLLIGACSKASQDTPAPQGLSVGQQNNHEIVVNPTYVPEVVQVPANAPFDLVFDKRSDSTCTEEVVFEGLGVTKHLPTGKKTVIHFDRVAPGEYIFHCGMNMVFGKMIATPTK